MTVEEKIKIWKSPEVRVEGLFDHPAGKGFQEMDEFEMAGICGGTDEHQPQTTTICAASVSAVVSFAGSYLVTAVFCKE